MSARLPIQPGHHQRLDPARDWPSDRPDPTDAIGFALLGLGAIGSLLALAIIVCLIFTSTDMPAGLLQFLWVTR